VAGDVPRCRGEGEGSGDSRPGNDVTVRLTVTADSDNQHEILHGSCAFFSSFFVVV
jgi:hypothetical protein